MGSQTTRLINIAFSTPTGVDNIILEATVFSEKILNIKCLTIIFLGTKPKLI